MFAPQQRERENVIVWTTACVLFSQFLVFSWYCIANGVELLYENKNQQNRFYQCDLHLTNHKPTAYIVFRRVFFPLYFELHEKKKMVVKVLVYNILRAQVQTFFVVISFSVHLTFISCVLCLGVHSFHCCLQHFSRQCIKT